MAKRKVSKQTEKEIDHIVSLQKPLKSVSRTLSAMPEVDSGSLRDSPEVYRYFIIQSFDLAHSGVVDVFGYRSCEVIRTTCCFEYADDLIKYLDSRSEGNYILESWRELS